MTPGDARPLHRRTPLQMALLLLLIFAAMCSLPYLAPVRPSVSLSYIAGFSNSAALALLLLGACLFAILTRGRLSQTDTQDRDLSFPLLIASLLIVSILFLARRWISLHAYPGVGALFFLNRQQLLAAGLAPYKQFDFMYGPLLLYPPVWIARALHTSQVGGYYIWLLMQWLIGTAMLWWNVRAIDFPIRFRRALFALLFLMQITALLDEGSNYTPFRNNIAAFLVLAVLTVRKRYGSAWKTSLFAVFAVTIALSCSLEQAVGVTGGLTAYFILLTLFDRANFPWPALVLFFAGTAATLALAAHGGMFNSLRGFASGGFSFPLLPSPIVFLFLFPYFVAACLFYRSLRDRQWSSVALPLTLSGAAMLPYALGRCDLGHLSFATPAFLLGIAGIFAMPAVRRWWLPLTLCFGILLPSAIALFVFVKTQPQRTLSTTNTSTRIDYRVPLDVGPLPCDRQYFSPALLPSPLAPFHPECLDLGQYRSVIDGVISPSAIQLKIDEMRQRPNMPLLMESRPLEQQFPTQEADMNILYALELSFYIPPARHAPLTFDPIVSYIRAHYTPGPLLNQGRLQIWLPTH